MRPRAARSRIEENKITLHLQDLIFLLEMKIQQLLSAMLLFQAPVRKQRRRRFFCHVANGKKKLRSVLLAMCKAYKITLIH